MTEPPPADTRPWYADVTGYQWLVLAIASAGWVFDAFEGQLFNMTRSQMLPDLLNAAAKSDLVTQWGEWLLSVFLVGGTLGGIVFGSLADRFGRKPIMALTILFYSVFSGLTYFATELWQVAALRFFVALGVGGEWAVAAALVSEVFPARARAQASSVFHATSIFGTWFAWAVTSWVEKDWRTAFLVGVVPALLVLWVRSGVEEPQRWLQAGEQHKRMGSIAELLGDWRWARSALLGMLLATVGLGMFWAVTVAGQDLTRHLLVSHGMDAAEAEQHAKFAYGFVQAAGAGLGLLCFGPMAARWGRKPAFAIMHIGAMLIVPATCYLPQTYHQLLAILPLYGFFTLGIHAGYAVYFPELFPAHLRATGAGWCFNGGRLLAAGFLGISGWVKSMPGMDLPRAISLLSMLFALGLVVLVFLPETKGRPLPE
jgi:MFS family permease